MQEKLENVHFIKLKSRLLNVTYAQQASCKIICTRFIKIMETLSSYLQRNTLLKYLTPEIAVIYY